MKSIIHSTENNNFYLYDTQRILSMLIHPELKKIHEKSTDINIDAYYLKKYSYLVKEYITQTKVIVFEITDYCNLKCKYCSLGDLYNFSKKESKNINIKYALNFLRYIFNVKHKKTKLTISFFGGRTTCQFSCYTTNNRRSETFKQKQKIGLNVQYDNKCHLNTQIYRLYS